MIAAKKELCMGGFKGKLKEASRRPKMIVLRRGPAENRRLHPPAMASPAKLAAKGEERISCLLESRDSGLQKKKRGTWGGGGAD